MKIFKLVKDASHGFKLKKKKENKKKKTSVSAVKPRSGGPY